MAVALLTAVAVPAPVHAQDSGDTTVTLTVEAGALTIGVPATKDLGTAGAGGQATGQLGTVQVVDERGLLVGAWTATVSSTSFTTGGGTGPETIPTGNISYWSGPATATTGLGVPVPGQLTALNAVTLDQTRTAFSKALGAGNNSTSWNPTLIVSVPASAVAGSYTGTVTHSVA